jgi:hypothetical protein
MSTKIVLAAVTVAFSLATGPAFAESEGNGAPYVFRADNQSTSGRAFVADTGSAAYPSLSGNTTQPSSLAQLQPAFGSEAPVQTANSLPLNSGVGTVAYAQAQSLNRHFAAQTQRARVLEAGIAHPGS